ncbi:hypothetical protein M1D35_21710 [Pseudomonas sp. Z1-24]|uniref:hypothetical protein n=1 Tax=unclassified Pseudomonas TaxID=196821 RepID=UPI003DA913F8
MSLGIAGAFSFSAPPPLLPRIQREQARVPALLPSRPSFQPFFHDREIKNQELRDEGTATLAGRGRKPKATVKKPLAGNPDKRVLNTDVPQFPTGHEHRTY